MSESTPNDPTDLMIADEFKEYEGDAAALAKAAKGALGTDEVKDNLESVEKASLPEIKLASGGAKGFKMPDDNIISELKCVILDAWNNKAFWLSSLEEGGSKMPDCYSLDGRNPHDDSEAAQSDKCRGCPQNAFGKDGTGKPCKDIKRVLMLLPGRNMPYIMSVPPTSKRAIEDYLVRLTDLGLPYSAVVSLLSTEIKKSGGGFDYAHLVPKEGALIAEPDKLKAAYAKMKEIKDTYRNVARGMVVETGDNPNTPSTRGTVSDGGVTQSPPPDTGLDFDDQF